MNRNTEVSVFWWIVAAALLATLWLLAHQQILWDAARWLRGR
jgi:hypothetical protein